MIDLLRVILCKDVLLDKETNAVSYINCIESLETTKLPSNLFPVTLATLWCVDLQKETRCVLKLRLILVRPDGSRETLFETPNKVLETNLDRINFHLKGLPIKEEGRHRFLFEYYQDGQWVPADRDTFLDIRLKKDLKDKTGTN